MCVCVCVCACVGMCECDAGIERDPGSCTYMSVQGPVVYFELVDKDLHRASDLVDL